MKMIISLQFLVFDCVFMVVTFYFIFPFVSSSSFNFVPLFQEAFLKRIGDKHTNYEFFRVLSLKCAYSIFSEDHVQGIVEDLLLRKDAGEQYLDTSTFDLLFVCFSVILFSCFPLEVRLYLF